MTDATADAEIVEALALRKRTRLNLMLIFLLVASAGLWSAWETDFNLVELVKGWGHINNLLARMFPPDLEIVQNLGGPLIETLQMALLGTTIPIFIAIPLAWLTATNIAPDPVLGNVIRLVLHTLRTVPELLWAMLLVTAVGLGTFPGTMALILHSTGSMGKFFYETIEAADPGVIEAMEATGANRFKVIMFGIMPTVLPNYLSIVLFSYNIKQVQTANMFLRSPATFFSSYTLRHLSSLLSFHPLPIHCVFPTVMSLSRAGERSGGMRVWGYMYIRVCAWRTSQLPQMP